MTKNSKIGWTDHTFNPWQGCEHVSPGCEHCYAEAISKRVGKPERWASGDEGVRDVTSDGYWRNPEKWNREALEAGRPALVFCASLADVFEDRLDLLEPRARLFDLIERTPALIWLLLTKRPENVLELVPGYWLTSPADVRAWGKAEPVRTFTGWPENVWIGTTVEDQARADERIPVLAGIPAPVRFLSCEPLLELVDVDAVPTSASIDWIIAGGESGAGHRPFDPTWARSLKVQAEALEVPYFFKQHGGTFAGAGGHLLDGELLYAWPDEAGDRSDLIEAARLEELGETSVEIS